MISLVIFIILAVNLLRNYYKWTIVILSLCPFLMQFILWQQNLLTYLLLLISILFPFKCKKPISYSLYGFPLKWACIAIGVSLFATNYFASYENKHTPIMLYMIVQNAIVLYIFYYLYKKDPNKVCKIFITTNFIFGMITCLYCLFEGVFKINPYIELMNSIKVYDAFDHSEVRHGIKRVQAFYSIYTSITGLALYLIPLLISYVRSKGNVWKAKYSIYLFLLFVMLFFSGMRSGIVCITICLMTFMNKRMLIPKNIFISILLSGIIAIFFYDYLYSFIDSMVHTDKVDGSTEDVRETQWTIAFLSFADSPIWGQGINYTFTDLAIRYPQLAGADSLWISLLVDQGIIGVISYLIFFISLLIFIYKQYSQLCFFVIGVLCSQTIATITSFPITHIFFYILIMIYLKNNKLITNHKPASY